MSVLRLTGYGGRMVYMENIGPLHGFTEPPVVTVGDVTRMPKIHPMSQKRADEILANTDETGEDLYWLKLVLKWWVQESVRPEYEVE